MVSPKQTWQVQVNEQIYEADFEELRQWIEEGAISPHDKVRRGNLRWLNAERVPELNGFFNLSPYRQTQTNLTITEDKTHVIENQIETFAIPQAIHQTPPDNVARNEQLSAFCLVHSETESFYACDTCGSYFCKICPKTFGSVKICPMCGAMCRLFSEPQNEKKSIGAVYKPYAQNENEIINPEDLLKQLGFAATLRCLGYAARHLSNRTIHKLAHPADSLKSLKEIFRQEKTEKHPRYFNSD